MDLQNLAVASPDVGGVKTARAYAKLLGDADLVVVDKRRPKHNVAEVMNIIGDVEGKSVVIVDDLIDTGSTFVQCAEALKAKGADQIVGVITHPVFSGAAIERIAASDALTRLIVADTIPLQRTHPKITVISVADLFAEAILRNHENESISSLFDITTT
jgi:ribose-phosphate pyrophosphokinase